MKENRNGGNGKEALKERERRKKGKKKQRYRKGKGKKRRIEGMQK